MTGSAGCCAREASGHATAVLTSADINRRFPMLIAIGPSNRGHAHWIIANDSTPQPAGL